MRKVLPYRFVPQTSLTVGQSDRWPRGSGFPPPEPPFFVRQGLFVASAKAGADQSRSSSRERQISPSSRGPSAHGLDPWGRPGSMLPPLHVFHAVVTPYLTTVARCGWTMAPGLRRGAGLTSDKVFSQAGKREAKHPRQPCVSMRETTDKPPRR